MSRIHLILAGLLAAGVLLWTSLVDAADRSTGGDALAAFDAVRYALPGSLTLARAALPAVEIEATDKQLEAIAVRVEDGTLVIERKRGWRKVDLAGIKVAVAYETLKALAVAGSGGVTTDALDSARFDLSVSGSASVSIPALTGDVFAVSLAGSGAAQVDALAVDTTSANISGSGDVQLTGRAEAQRLNIAGSGGYRAQGLSSRLAQINIAGSGDAEISVDEALEGSVLGSGDLRYRGTPAVDVNVLGSGTVAALARAL
jgi:hypothetical protein